MDDSAAVEDTLDERPELESPLREVLAVDEASEKWTFDDVPVDSGAFGELVSRGFVEKRDGGDGYRVSNPDAVRVALEDESIDHPGPTRESNGFGRPTIGREDVLARFSGVDRTTIGALLGGLLLVVVARTHVYASVFRDGAVVLSSNDPYYYRYWVEEALAAGGTFDGSGLATMSDAVQIGEPLLVATLWAFSSLLGGDATAAGWVLAWYPVVAGVITALLVYLLAMRVTADRRVAFAALLFLAITPAHAMRTSLGFADHHAFDYVWLMVTVYALVRLDGDWEGGTRPLWKWAWAGILGIGIAGQILAWDAGPLLVAPLGLYVAVRALHDVRSGASPIPAHIPLLIGVTVGSGLVLIVHEVIGWHTDTVAFAPVLLALGVAAVLVAGEIAIRFDVPVSILAAVEVAGAIVGLLALRTLRPSFWAELMDGVDRITRDDAIAETQSLLSGDAFGWLLLFGFVLVLAVPYLVWSSSRAYRGDEVWFVPVVYCWCFLILAMFQVRFAGQLAMFASAFAGIGFVHLASVVDLTERPVPFEDGPDEWPTVNLPEARTLGYFVVLFALVGGLSFVQVPVKAGQVTTDGDAYRTAAWMDEYAEDEGWEYPENYVFSEWGQNRMYNYFVNGESSSYSFAQENFGQFSLSEDEVRWYQRLNEEVGFIVTADGNREPGANTLHARLSQPLENLHKSGSLLHYRALHQSRSGERRVYTLVPGARVTGPTTASMSQIETGVNLTHRTFTYDRQIDNDHGVFVFTTPYPGTYTVGDQRVTVTEEDVFEGNDHNLFDGPGAGNWGLDEGSGTVAYDRWGGDHLHLNGTEWTEDGVDFHGEDAFGTAKAGEELSVSADESLTVRMTIQGNFSRTTEAYPTVFAANGPGLIGIWARNVRPDFGVRIDDDEGDIVRLFGMDQLHFESPTTVTMVLDRDAEEVRLYRNESLVGSQDASALDAVTVTDPLTVGARTPESHPAPVVVSDLQVYRDVNPPTKANTTG